MSASRIVIMACLCSLAAVGSVFSADKTHAATGTSEGNFAGIQKGDHVHFLIQDKHGRQESFVVLRDDRSIDSYVRNAKQLRGRSVRVYWKEEMIPEAGRKMKAVTKVEARNPLEH